jgi:ABC-type transport system involved in multi-copper enzyme maturation permease subunit
MNRGTRTIVGRLIAKDLFLYRGLILGALVAGIFSLFVSHWSEGDNETSGLNLGFILFLTTVVAFGVTLPMYSILRERQDRSQLFVLSLPVSPAQYAIAKVGAAVLAFLAPWLVLTLGVVAVTLATGAPDGAMPFFVALMTFLLFNFCLLTAISVVTQSELAAVVGILLTNVSVSIFIVRVAGLPGVAGRQRDAEATWSPAILTVLAVEAVAILLALGLAFYLPSRRKDFV